MSTVLDLVETGISQRLLPKLKRQRSLPASFSASSPLRCYRRVQAQSRNSQNHLDMRGNSLRTGPRPANSMEQDSFDSYDDDTMEDMLVMSTSGLRLSPSSSPGGGTAGSELTASSGAEEEEELPKSIIVTNVDLSVFDNENIKANFESMFREYESSAMFHYLRSFRRIRIDFDSHVAASNAKVNMDNSPVGGNIIHCYFVQVLSPCTDDAFLHVPPLEKQFLISPPCSPPVGWEQPKEDKPVIDYDLLSAMAQLAPGEKHELHPTKEINVLGKSISTPSIVVHIAEDEATVIPRIVFPSGCTPDGCSAGSKSGKKIKPTRCPDRQSSLD